MATVPLSEAALKLGKTYHQVRAMVLKGDLAGGVDGDGRWFVRVAALRRFERKRGPEKSAGSSNAGGPNEA
jgi:hypothetical protein